MFDGGLVGLMAAGSFPFTIRTKKRIVSQRAMEKVIRPFASQAHLNILKPLANLAAARSQNNLHTELYSYLLTMNSPARNRILKNRINLPGQFSHQK
jgi:hypothetical protein